MIDIILKLIYYMVYSLELFLVGEWLFHNRVKKKIKYIVVGGIYILLIVPTILFMKEPPYVLFLGVNIFIYVYLFQGKLLLKLMRLLGVSIFASLTEGVVSAIGTFLLQKHLESYGMNMGMMSVRVTLAILASFLTLVIVSRGWVKKFINYFHALKWFHYIAIIMILLSGISLMAMSQSVLNFVDNKKVGVILYIAITVLMLAAFFIIVWLQHTIYSREYYLKQNELKEEIIRTQQQYYQNIYENDREMRKFRHDIRSQLGCLHLLMKEGKIEQASKHLEVIEKNFEKVNVDKCQTGNEILDVIINQKYMEARKKDIDIKVEGKLEHADFMNAYDLCTIFSNAINNGIEACEKICDKEKTLRISILEHGRTVFFRFMNPATWEMYEALKQNRTTKEDSQSHGFGVENIRTTVERNNGELEYQYKDEKITLEVYFEV